MSGPRPSGRSCRRIRRSSWSRTTISPWSPGSAYERARSPRTARWALVRSMAKVLGPDLRVALVASDPATEDQLRRRLVAGVNWVSHLLQATAAALLADPKRHLRASPKREPPTRSERHASGRAAPRRHRHTGAHRWLERLGPAGRGRGVRRGRAGATGVAGPAGQRLCRRRRAQCPGAARHHLDDVCGRREPVRRRRWPRCCAPGSERSP